MVGSESYMLAQQRAQIATALAVFSVQPRLIPM